jgi:peroxiredoxin
MMILFFSVILLMLPHPSQTQTKLSAVAQSAEEICPLKVGAHLPDITLPSFEGKPVNLLAEVTNKPTILIFYRGGWCVYCNTQMMALKNIEKDLLALGYQLIAISPDRPEKLRETIDRYELQYTLLSDSKAMAAQAFGLAFRVSDETLQRYKAINIDLEEASGEQHHLLPVPAAFVVGKDGVVRFSYVNPNYRVRIDPAVLLAAAKAALK